MSKEQSAKQTGGLSELAKTDKGKIDPVTFTILPIVDELLTFTKVMPPDLSKWNSGHFEKLYSKLETPKIPHWLDCIGFSNAAGKFETDLNSFLIRFRKWENELRRAGIISTEQLSKLQDTNERLFWGLKQELDEIYDDADKTAKWLKNLVWMITQKRQAVKSAKINEQQSKQKANKDIILPEKHLKVLRFLSNQEITMMQTDIAMQSEAGNEKTISLIIKNLTKYHFAGKPQGHDKGTVITQEGREYLKGLDSRKQQN